MRKITTLLITLPLLLAACGSGTTSPTPGSQPGPGTGTGTGTTPTTIPHGDPSTITIAQLRGCPLADGVADGVIQPAVVSCTAGTLNGITSPTGQEKCSLTMDGHGKMTFSSSNLKESIVFSPDTRVYFIHTKDSGLDTVLLTFENNYYAKTGKVSLGFAFYEFISSPDSPNIYIDVSVDQQKDGCYAWIK